MNELILLCRSESARSYISEAVSCYNGRAYRSAIIATWIAVLFDFIHKLRELEMAGDNAARQKLATFDAARNTSDLRASLEFERNLVDSARDDFQFISPIEAIDIQRLFDDRNRCAHSSMVSPDEPYMPSAELARTHIYSAVTILLQHPPAQGRSALDRIWADIGSEFFPKDTEEALRFLRDGPLGRARKPVVRDVIIGLTKDVLKERRKQAERARQIAALRAVFLLYPQDARDVIAEKLSPIFDAVSDQNFDLAIRYISNVQQAWEHIGIPAQLKAVNYVQNGPTETSYRYLPHALDVHALRELALSRIQEVDDDTFAKLIKARPASAFIPRAILLWSESRGWRTAEARLEQLIIPLSSLFSSAEINKIAEAFSANDQITYASGTTDGLLEVLQGMQNPDSAKVEWKKIYDVLNTHNYYADGRGSDLREALETRFGFSGPS
ncbi:hypothetical protein P8935_23990 [Telmatobacter sp. DSM 110680]|uniref:Apea-like HEPN domain-containing protein n=1 Tax=Telmatobacter sp. DSM 110680 TaxID=3036704 RepID=A0AAU7DKK8_9BACT